MYSKALSPPIEDVLWYFGGRINTSHTVLHAEYRRHLRRGEKVRYSNLETELRHMGYAVE